MEKLYRDLRQLEKDSDKYNFEITGMMALHKDVTQMPVTDELRRLIVNTGVVIPDAIAYINRLREALERIASEDDTVNYGHELPEIAREALK